MHKIATETEIRAHVGTTVALPVEVDKQQCGQLHSLKWYKAEDRVYVLSHAGQGEGGRRRHSKATHNCVTHSGLEVNELADSLGKWDSEFGLVGLEPLVAISGTIQA
ncbi:hypothetical protein NQ317_009704 [Molorchus minor]|uniref:Uncharacterized protein n=1 Tax=Molorchus minor TaxID=1323400 RepID=A0ABQ9IXN4_9CUCU|nr:hypothetical protein NQ317_009704 [Molorchus minor]